jgi:imidazoleglycerol-phosphate dehydratase
MTRKGERRRETSETQIRIGVDLDGDGTSSINTTIPFFDHMLTLMAKHGFFTLEIDARGDTEVDLHHTVEDTGISLGEALKAALGDRAGIRRYGQATVPMDEALATVSIDLCSRPYLVYNVEASAGGEGAFTIDMGEQFFRALVSSLAATVHLNLHYGANQHHILEALFKAFGRALSDAVSPDPRLKGVLSTKGTL